MKGRLAIWTAILGEEHEGHLQGIKLEIILQMEEVVNKC